MTLLGVHKFDAWWFVCRRRFVRLNRRSRMGTYHWQPIGFAFKTREAARAALKAMA